MISLKRQCPFTYDNAIVIDSDPEEGIGLKIQPRKLKNPNLKKRCQNPYDAIQEVPTFKLTVAQMNSDPLELMAHYQMIYQQYGAVKLTVCEAWNCPFNFGNVDRPVTVRKQTLQELKDAKPFQQRVQSLRISQYKQIALAFSKNYKFKTNPAGETAQSKREHQYWNLVTKHEYLDNEVTVQYAADLPSSLYGSGFPTRKVFNWLDADFSYENNFFNLNNLYKSPHSILRIIDDKKEKISGITIPWMYVGMQFATFCWHVEDLYLNSVNYNHNGETKTWYVIPGHHKQLFDQYVKTNYEKNKKRNLLEKITLMIDPLELIRAGIKVYKINQRPRDYVVTFLKAYHCGFSHGFNIGQAVNFLSYKSIEGIKESIKFYEQQQILSNKKLKSHVLSYQWMIYEIINKKYTIPVQFSQKISKQYKRVINRQFIFVKSTLDKFGEFTDVRIIPYKKRYYNNMCTFCKNYLYLTSLECSTCHKNLCERHLNKCECKQKAWVLVVRQLNQDRLKLKELVPMITARQQTMV